MFLNLEARDRVASTSAHKGKSLFSLRMLFRSVTYVFFGGNSKTSGRLHQCLSIGDEWLVFVVITYMAASPTEVSRKF